MGIKHNRIAVFYNLICCIYVWRGICRYIMKFDESKNLWFVSDTHFNHQRLVESCPFHFEEIRKYKTVFEMNEDIITKWNENIKADDKPLFKIRYQKFPVEPVGFCREHRYRIPRGFMYLSPCLVYPQRTFDG